MIRLYDVHTIFKQINFGVRHLAVKKTFFPVKYFYWLKKKWIIMLSILPSVGLYRKMTVLRHKMMLHFKFTLNFQELFADQYLTSLQIWSYFQLQKYSYDNFCVSTYTVGKNDSRILHFLKCGILVQKNMFTIFINITLLLSTAFYRTKISLCVTE